MRWGIKGVNKDTETTRFFIYLLLVYFTLIHSYSFCVEKYATRTLRHIAQIVAHDKGTGKDAPNGQLCTGFSIIYARVSD